MIDDPRSFHDEARYQRVCAKCKRPTRDWEAHHVIEQRHCKQHGWPRHDTRNAMRLCAKSAAACHERHTSGQERVPLVALRDASIAFAVEVMGAERAHEYLTRRYAGSDPRVDQLLRLG